MFTAGLVLFGLASLLVGAAPAAWWLVSARAVQGVGAAVLAPSSLALLTATFPPAVSSPRPGTAQAGSTWPGRCAPPWG
jgi:MFS family permease